MLTLSALHHHRSAAGESTLPLASTSHAQGLPAAQIGLAHPVASASEPPELPEEPPEVVYRRPAWVEPPADLVPGIVPVELILARPPSGRSG